MLYREKKEYLDTMDCWQLSCNRAKDIKYRDGQVHICFMPDLRLPENRLSLFSNYERTTVVFGVIYILRIYNEINVRVVWEISEGEIKLFSYPF